MQREKRTQEVWITNTFFITKLSENGYAYHNVQQRTHFDIFSLHLMLIPIHVDGSHWTCAGINFQTISFYDSTGHEGRIVLQILLRYLKDEHKNLKKRNSPLPNPEEYQLISPGRSIPQQHNGSDCGVFMSQFLKYLSSNDAFNFNQTHTFA